MEARALAALAVIPSPPLEVSTIAIAASLLRSRTAALESFAPCRVVVEEEEEGRGREEGQEEEREEGGKEEGRKGGSEER